MKTFFKLKYFLSITTIFAFPFLVFSADFTLAGQNFSGVIAYILTVLYMLVPILSALAFILFFWGLSKFILNSGSKDGIEKGKNYMLWGILALFILMSYRAIIGFVVTDLEFGTGAIPLLPTGGSATVTDTTTFQLPGGPVLTP